MAAGQQIVVKPYMFKKESNPEKEEPPEESQQPRMNLALSQWLVVNFVYLLKEDDV